MSAELADTSDALVGHFVDRCRAAGHTWAEISAALGVTRQAAHKRYAGPAHLGRFTERAKAVLGASVEAARRLGHGFVGTEHLLLGLFPPGGIAADLLVGAGVTEDVVTTAVLARTPAGATTGADVPAYTPRAAEVFGRALTEAISLGHNYIGTEHLLLALIGDPEGAAGGILAGGGLTHEGVRLQVVQILAGYPPR
jgi:ATP-dependent Clp protease ATP-binding subunit ClpA